MTARTPSADDLVDTPFLDDAARAESEWLLAREVNPTAGAPSSKIANDYAELEDLLGNLPQGLPDESWHDDLLRIASRSAPASRPWWRQPTARWAFGGAFAIASAVALWLIAPRAPAELEVAILHGDQQRGDPTRGDPTRGDEIAVAPGDHLIVTARPREPADLRVYRSGGALVASCPGGPGCSASARREYTIEIALDALGRYQVVLVVGPFNAPPGGTMDEYLAAARAANARIVMYAPINAR